jgi:twinkle protein
VLVSADDFRNLKVQEELSSNAVDSVAYPHELVARAMEKRAKADEGIQPPWAKLKGSFALRPGELVLAGGYSGHGKSAVMSQWGLAAAAAGNPTGFISLELPAEFLFDQLASFSAVVEETPESYLKEFAAWMEPLLFIYDKVDVMTPEEALQACIGLVKFFGCKLIILDCLFMVSLADDLEAERAFSQKLAAVAKSFDVCIVLVHHFRKPAGEEGEKKMGTKHSFIGSSHLVNVSSSVLIVHENKEKTAARNDGLEVDDSFPDISIAVAKQRYHRYEGVTGYWLHDKVRLLCGTSQRNYQPIEIRKQMEERMNEG